MKRKFINALLFCGLVAGTAVTLASCEDYDDDIDSLQAQIDEINDDTTLDDAVSSMESTISSSLSELESTQSELETNVSDLQDDIDNLQDQISSAASTDDITTLESEIQELTNQIATLSGSASSVESTVTTLEAALDSIEDLDLLEQFEVLNTAISEANAYITTAKETANDALTLATENSETLTTVLESLATVQASIEASITELSTELSTAVDNIAQNASNIKAINAELDALGDTYVTYDSLQTKLDDLLQDAKEYTDELIATISGDVDGSSTISDLQTSVANLIAADETLSDRIDSLASVNAGYTEEIEDIKASVNLLLGITKQLKSLVFSPYCYYEGIEAIKMSYYSYEALSLSVADKTKDQSSDAATATGTTKSVAPKVVANYFANPSNSAIDYNDVSKFGYIGNTAEYVTRSESGFNAESDIEVTSAYSVDATTGEFAVEFSVVNAENISSLSDGDYVDVVALQYTYTSNEEDTTVTSDFAALYKEEVNEFYINFADSGKVDDTSKPDAHLATTAAEAISDYVDSTLSYPVIYLPYTWEAGINLDDYINVHKTSSDVLWGGQATINEENFSLVYELIGYFADDSDDTSESEHATIDGTLLTIHGVDETYDASSARKLIGRTPLVRVSLVDNSNDNAIAAVGYIIVEICDVDKVVKITHQTLTVDPITDDYTVVCNDDIVYDGAATTWLAIENKLLGTLNMSKAEFEEIYTLYNMNDADYGTYGAVQYSYDEANDAFSEIQTSDYVGVVTSTADEDTENYETAILEWIIGNQYAYEQFVEAGVTSVSTWVKFNPSSSAYDEIYIQLTWEPGNLPIDTITATIEDSDKKFADWHANNSREAGYDDVHFQVGAATDPDATCDFEPLTLNTTFNNTPSEIVANAISTYSSVLADSLVTYYRFAAYNYQDVQSYTGVSGTSYEVSVPNDTTIAVKGSGTILATLNEEDGTVTLNETDELKDILNAPTYGDYATSLTFTIELYAATCEPAGEDFVTIANNTLDVIVVKPLYIEGATVTGMQWNNYSTLTQKITVDSVMDFNGYNPETFYENSGSTITLFDFYEVDSIYVDVDNATTNYATGNDNFIAIDTLDFTITYNGNSDFSGTEPYFGSVTLAQNKTSRSNSFEVKIPISVFYRWGIITDEVTVTVEAASGPAKKN